MPLLILQPVPPLPPLPTYFALSFLFLLWSVLQAREELAVFDQSGIPATSASVMDPDLQTLNLTHFFDIHKDDMTVLKYVKSMVRDSWSVLVLCNVAFCFLLVLGMGLQWLIFGKLREVERQHVRDKLWNFAFYKFIVVFGVLNVQTLEEMIFWVAWFATFAFLHAFAQLSKDRFEYLSFSPATTNSTHAKVLGLLVNIFAISIALGGLCVYIGNSHGLNLLLFMIAECLLLAFRSFHVILKYGIHLYDLHYEGVWEKRGTVIYYTELLMELVVLGIDLIHHVHMLLWGNVFLSMASLVICLQIRFLYNEVQRRVQRHQNYRKVVHNMETRFANASEEELQRNDDDCAICWEEMRTARKLPCKHLFHDGCLRSWLEHETSCPTCRQSLNITQTEAGTGQQRQGAATPRMPAGPPGMVARNRTVRVARRGGHFFHFDGSMIASWMPSFSVEVTHANAVRRLQLANRNSQFNIMANQVIQMFPRIAYDTALNDLRITRSVELTVENIVEGRLVEANTPPESPSSSEAPSSPATPSTPGVQEDTYSPLLRSTGYSSQSTMPSGPDQPSTSSAWHQVTERGDGSNGDASQYRGSSVDAPSHNGADDPSYSATAARFSKSSIERQNMLQLRKERLLQEARRKYAQSESETESSQAPSQAQESSPFPVNHHRLDRHLNPNTNHRGGSVLYPENEAVMRRNAVLEATLRRLNQHQ